MGMFDDVFSDNPSAIKAKMFGDVFGSPPGMGGFRVAEAALDQQEANRANLVRGLPGADPFYGHGVTTQQDPVIPDNSQRSVGNIISGAQQWGAEIQQDLAAVRLANENAAARSQLSQLPSADPFYAHDQSGQPFTDPNVRTSEQEQAAYQASKDIIGKPAGNIAITPFVPALVRAAAGAAFLPFMARDIADTYGKNTQPSNLKRILNGEEVQGNTPSNWQAIAQTGNDILIQPVVEPAKRAISNPVEFIQGVMDDPNKLWSDVFLPGAVVGHPLKAGIDKVKGKKVFADIFEDGQPSAAFDFTSNNEKPSSNQNIRYVVNDGVDWNGVTDNTKNAVSQLIAEYNRQFPDDTLTITDGKRPENADYGSPTSYHKAGSAADLWSEKLIEGSEDGAARRAWLENKAREMGFGEVLNEIDNPSQYATGAHFHVADPRGKYEGVRSQSEVSETKPLIAEEEVFESRPTEDRVYASWEEAISDYQTALEKENYQDAVRIAQDADNSIAERHARNMAAKKGIELGEDKAAMIAPDSSATPKEPWQMTRDEFIQAATDSGRKGDGGVPLARFAGDRHENVVVQAVQQGKPVPEAVLKDYPEREYMAASGMTVPKNSPRPATPSGAAVSDTITRREIVDKVNELFTKVSTGRLGVSGVLGWFDRNSEVVRTKDYADFRTIMHEIGHYLDKGLGLRNDSRFDSELLGAVQNRFDNAYNHLSLAGRRGEGIAEFIHDYTINPARAKQEFPTYFQAFEQRLAQEKQIKGKVEDIKAKLHTWHNQAAEARGRGSITYGYEQRLKPIAERAKDVWYKFYEKLVDDKVGLARFVKEIEKAIGEKLLMTENPYQKARIALSSAVARAQMLVEDKNPSAVKTVLNKIYSGVIDNGVTIRSIVDSLNEKELNAKYPNYLKNGNFKNWTEALDTYLVAQRQTELQGVFPDYIGPMLPADAKAILQKAPLEVRQAAGRFYIYNDNILRLEVEGGLLSKENYADLKKKYQYYASMMRDFSETEAKAPSNNGGKGFGNVNSSLKSISEHGSAKNVHSPLESAIIHTYDVLSRIERNKVSQVFAKLAENHGVARLIEEVSGGAASKDSVFTVMTEGRKKSYQTTPEIYRAIMSMNQESANILTKFLSVPAGWLRAGATLTPDFVLRNLARDTFSAAIYSKHGFVPLVDTAKGLAQLINNEELYYEYRASGAQMANFVSMDRDTVSRSINKLIEGHLIQDVNPIELLRKFSDVAETSTRLGEFAKARKAGKSIEESGLAAKDITVDFNRAGTFGRNWNKIAAFFNASIQGTDRMVRAFKEDPIGFNVKATLYVTMPTVALWVLNHDQEWYKEEPDWRKNVAWMFKAGDTIVRIPKPPGLGQIYGSSIEAALNYYYQKDPKRVTAWARDTAMSFVPNFMPTVAGPLVEWFSNYSFFTGRNIVPKREEEWEPHLQYGPYTSETAKAVGKTFNVSPRKVDNTIQGYGASLGKMATTTVDYAVGKYDNMPKQQIENLPGVRSILGQPYQSSQSVQDFYDKLSEQKSLHNTYKATGRKPNGLNLELYEGLKSIEKEMKQIHDHEKTIMANQKLSSEEKKNRLDQLQIIAINKARNGLGNKRQIKQ